jgi:hypothetical protein
MKNTAIIGGIAVAILLVLGLRKRGQPAITEDRIHDLQDKFKSLDVA